MSKGKTSLLQRIIYLLIAIIFCAALIIGFRRLVKWNQLQKEKEAMEKEKEALEDLIE